MIFTQLCLLLFGRVCTFSYQSSSALVPPLPHAPLLFFFLVLLLFPQTEGGHPRPVVLKLCRAVVGVASPPPVQVLGGLPANVPWPIKIE